MNRISALLSKWNHRRLHRRRARRARSYKEWIESYDEVTPTRLEYFRLRASELRLRPSISVIMPVFNPDVRHLEAAIASVEAQVYDNWELCIADDASTDPQVRKLLERAALRDARIKVAFRERNGHISEASNTALTLASGEFVALLDQDDLLRPHALQMVAEAITVQPDAGILYSDEDKIDDAGNRHEPYFKCDWNEYLFRSHNMVCHLGVYRASLVAEVGGFRKGYEGSQDYDLCLRCSERLTPAQIVHLPFVLYHWRSHDKSTAQAGEAKPYARQAGELALQEHLDRIGVAGQVRAEEHGYRITYTIPAALPSVAIIIPTKDKADLLEICLSSILEKTTYGNYEVIIVDNGSVEPATLQLFSKYARNPRIRILSDPRPFNFSQLNNRAVSETNVDYLCLMNNDIEVLSETWLGELIGIAIQPGVGAVGARLWYPDMTLQHGGVVMGIGGCAGHVLKRLPRESAGYSRRNQLVQEYSAVTAACLVVERGNYLKVGGLNEVDLAIAFNDVDFCLKLMQHGLRNVWTPHAELIHHESISRGFEDNPKKQARFLKELSYMRFQWSEVMNWDPAYSPNLTLDYEDFSFSFPPRVSLDDPYWLTRRTARR